MKLREVYMMHKVHDNSYKIVKVLNEYDNEDAAKKALTKLLTKEISEKDLLKEFSK